jgi:hypothetical protein
MINIDRTYGKDYAANLIDQLLGFNTAQNWTVSSGTGLVNLNSNFYFEGVSSLKIENTDPVNNISITNSAQSTLVKTTGNYDFSLYALKSEVNTAMTLTVNVFKDAVLLETSNLVLGSTTASDDIDQKWVRFQSETNYSLTAGDIITFTFVLNGIAGTGKTSISIYLDGLMFNSKERISLVVPEYVKPLAFLNRLGTIPVAPTGDGNYQLTVASGGYSWTLIP